MWLEKGRRDFVRELGMVRFFFKDLFTYLKGKVSEGETHREDAKERDLPSVDSFPRWPQ